MKPTTLQVRVGPGVLARLDAIAATLRLTRSAAVRWAIGHAGDAIGVPPAGRQGAAMRPPTAIEVAEVGRTAGLIGSEAGRLLGVSSRQWRRWLSGECAMPAATYQWLLVATGLHPDYGPRRARR